MAEANEATEGRRRSPMMTGLLGGITLGLLLGGGVGGYACNGQRLAATQAHDAQVECQAQLEALQVRTTLLDARVALARTLAELDDRNFGTAKQELAKARAALAGSTSPDAQPLVQQIGSFTLEVTNDLEAQRLTVRGMAEALDKVLAR